MEKSNPSLMLVLEKGFLESWDECLGFPVEEAVGEMFVIDRVNNCYGVLNSHLASIQFDCLFGLENLMSESNLIPQHIIDEWYYKKELSRPKSIFRKALKKVRNVVDGLLLEDGGVVYKVTPIELLDLNRQITKLRFELMVNVLIRICNSNSQEVERLEHFLKTDIVALEDAYRHLHSMVGETTINTHIKKDPRFLSVSTRLGGVKTTTLKC